MAIRHEEPLVFDHSWSAGSPAPVIWMRGKVDQDPIRLLVDTGSQLTLLNARTLNSRGVDLKPIEDTASFCFMNHEADRYVTDLEFLEIGPYRIGGTPVWAADFPGELTARNVEGIVGMDVLSELNAVISFPGRAVAFHSGTELSPPSAHQAVQPLGFFRSPERQYLVVERDAGRISRGFLPARVNGRPLMLMIDTGSRRTILDRKQLHAKGVILPRIRRKGKGDENLLRLTDRSGIRFAIGDIDVPISRVCVTDLGEAPAKADIPYDGVIGTELLVELQAVLNINAAEMQLVDQWDRGNAPVVRAE